MNIARLLIALFLVSSSSIAGTIHEAFPANMQDVRLYQSGSSSNDNAEDAEEEEQSSGTPDELLLETEPEC